MSVPVAIIGWDGEFFAVEQGGVTCNMTPSDVHATLPVIDGDAHGRKPHVVGRHRAGPLPTSRHDANPSRRTI